METFLAYLETISNDSVDKFSLYALKTQHSPIVATKIPVNCNHLGDFSKDCILYLKNKQYQNRSLQPYPYGLPKDHIESLSLESDSITEKYHELLNAIASPETNNVDLDKYNAYAIVYENNNCEAPTIFINMKKPLRTFKKHFMFKFIDNNYTKIDTAFLNLVMHFDCIISANTCYFVTLAVEDFFGLTKYYKKETNKNIELLISNNLVDDLGIDTINTFLNKRGKYKALTQVDSEILSDLSNLDSEKFSIKKITLSSNFMISFSSYNKKEIKSPKELLMVSLP